MCKVLQTCWPKAQIILSASVLNILSLSILYIFYNRSLQKRQSETAPEMFQSYITKKRVYYLRKSVRIIQYIFHIYIYIQNYDSSCI